jgi:hypothetical protein
MVLLCHQPPQLKHCAHAGSLQITHLFKQVLHGNGRFVMVVNVSPASEAFNETKRVLQVMQLSSQHCTATSKTANTSCVVMYCVSTML